MLISHILSKITPNNSLQYGSIDITKIDKDAPSKPTSIAITPSLNKITVKENNLKHILINFFFKK